RSMVANAEELRRKVEALNEKEGPIFKARNDPRMTRVGRFIRKYSIDELPQLWNVLRGEMSLVGPRPPLPHEVAQYSWNQRRRLSVKPGMTGLSQVKGLSELTFKETVDLDLTYIDQWSIFLVFRILLMTIPAVIRGRGAV
ncbi:MAG: sugar transferase, partial [Candidatus Hydrogenedentes bacterium]|nr:sugar transferase [Candidatus Hydrogenedentota bacterium]